MTIPGTVRNPPVRGSGINASELERLEELNRKAQRRGARLSLHATRFLEMNRDYRKWISIAEVCKFCVDHHAVRFPNEASAYNLIAEDFGRGCFEDRRFWRSRVLLVADGCFIRVTSDYIRSISNIEGFDLNKDYWGKCWIPRDLFEGWAERRALDALKWFKPTREPRADMQPRFEPREEDQPPAETQQSSAQEHLAEQLLTAILKTNPDIKKPGAKILLEESGIFVSDIGFKQRVWPKARRLAGLPERAAPGAPKKSR